MLQVLFASAHMHTHVCASTYMHKYMQIHTHTKGWYGETGLGFSGRILAYSTQALGSIPRMGRKVSEERSHDGAHLKFFPRSGLMIDKQAVPTPTSEKVTAQGKRRQG